MTQTAKEKAWDEGAAYGAGWAKHKAQARIAELEAENKDFERLLEQADQQKEELAAAKAFDAEAKALHSEAKLLVAEKRIAELEAELADAEALRRQIGTISAQIVERHDRVAELEAEVTRERARSHDFENENRRLRTALSFALGEG